MRAIIALMFLSAITLWGTTAQAHPLAPALLELQQTNAEQWEVSWRLSTKQRSSEPPSPRLPDVCKENGLPMFHSHGQTLQLRWQYRCPASGLVGETIRIDGLDRTPINVILRVTNLRGERAETLLDTVTPAYTITEFIATPPVWQRYLLLGIDHLILGPDHLLFLLVLILLSATARQLAITLTAFTVGHSITLSLAALGWISVNAMLMELSIAVSLVLAARELLSSGKRWLFRYPALMATLFGLLHGLGFASALAETGLPEDAILVALLNFNIGIELAQLLVALPVWWLLQRWQSRKPAAASPAAPFAIRPLAYTIGCVAVVWCIERAVLATAIF